ncbi:MAG: hemolysin family protein [Planctomycetota bacterium]|jgi:CBS domain containing-hemolysin-like protein|nr:hemolysin family protein [Planctomycetota bacterium]
MPAGDVPSWLEGVMLAVLGLCGLLGGAYGCALAAASRSRIQRRLEKGEVWAEDFVARIASNDPSIAVRADLLSSSMSVAFILYGLWVFLPDGAAPAAGRFFWTGALLLLLHAALRGLASLLGCHYAERLAVGFALPVLILTFPLAPASSVALWAKRVFVRVFGMDGGEEDEREAEVIDAVSDGQLDGVFEPGQTRMIEGIFEFRESDVADIIVPRTEMTMIDADSPLAAALNLALEKGYSRLPAYKGTRDHIVGIFHIRDALLYWDRPESGRPALESLLRPPLFVPETKRIPELLTEMARGQSHMAVVLDEYGGTAGLVTMEDVLEEIVGDIQDEFDAGAAGGGGEAREIEEGVFVADGNAHVADVNKLLDEEVLPEDDDFETVAGFVLDNLGHIPAAGETFVFDGRLEVKVLQADERRVRRVRLARVRGTEGE